MRWLALLAIAPLVGLAANPAPAREDLNGTTWENLSDPEVGARLAWNQAGCFRLAISSHEGTASEEQREALYSGASKNLKEFVRNARTGKFPESPNIPWGMTVGGEWKFDSVDFAAGRLFQIIADNASDPIYKREWSAHFKDDTLDNYGDPVPSEEWADRATLLFVKEGCPKAARGKLICSEDLGCVLKD